MTTTNVPTVANLLADYEILIRDRGDYLTTYNRAKRDLESAEYELALAKARMITAGLEGANEAQRNANLMLLLDADPTASTCRRDIQDNEQRMADAERELTLIRMRTRLLDHHLGLTKERSEMAVAS